jgi:PAS domain S-box-containing protein
MEELLLKQGMDLETLSSEEMRALIQALQVRQAELEKQNEALRQSEKRFRLMADALPVFIAYIDSEYRYRFNNKMYEKWFGYTQAEIYGRHVKEVVGEAVYQVTSEHLETALSGQEVTCEKLITFEGGRTRYMQITYVPHFGEEENVKGCFVLASDITERKQIEDELRQSKERFQVALKGSPISVFNQDQDLRYAWFYNPHHGVKSEAILGKTDADFFLPEEAARLTEIKRRVLERGVGVREEVQITVNGGMFFYDLTVEPLRDATGNVVGFTCATMDITQRKQAELGLHRSLQRLEILHQFDQAILGAQPVETIAQVALDRMQSLIPYQVAGVLAFDFAANVATLLAARRLDQVMTGQKRKFPLEMFQHLEELRVGHVRQVADVLALPQPGPIDQALQAHGIRAYVSIPLIAKGELLGLLNLGLDRPGPFDAEYMEIAREVADQLAVAVQQAHLRERVQRHNVELERRVAEQTAKLRQERNFISAVLDTAGALVAVIDPQGRIVRFNRACEQLSGYTFAEVKGKHFWDLFILPEEVVPVRAIFAKLRAGQFPNEYENYWVARSGDRHLITWSNTVLLNQEGSVAYIIAIGIDITERRQAEAALAEERNLLRTLIDTLPDYIYFKDTESRFITANQAVAKVMGAQTTDELIGKTDFDFYPHELAAQYYADEQQVVRSRQPLINQKEHVIDPSDQRRWVLTTKVPLQNSHGQIVGLVGVGRDITEWMQAEKALQESEERYKMLLRAVTDYIYTVHVEQGQVITTVHSPGCVAVTGYTAQEFATDPHLWYRMVYEADREMVVERVARVFAGESVPPFEHRLIHKDGFLRWVKNTWVPRYNDAGQLVAYDGLIADVTERKLAEEALRESQALLDGIISTATDAIITIDSKQRIVLFNAAAEQMFCYQASEVIGQPLGLLLPERFRRRHAQHVHCFVQAGISARVMEADMDDLWGRRADGEEFPIEAMISQVKVSGQKFCTVILRDVTGRKQMEEALKAHSHVLESMAEGVLVTDEDDIIYFTNPAFDAMFGYEPGELIGQHTAILNLDPMEKDVSFAAISQILQTQEVWLGEFSNKKKDGTPFTTASRISLLEMSGKRYLVSVEEDVTEQNQAEAERAQLFEAVNRQRQQLRLLTRRLAEAQEAERKQLTRELHDQVGQSLTALDLNLNVIRSQIPDDLSTAVALQARLDDSLALVAQTTRRIRDLMADLRPPVLDDYGLVAALDWYSHRLHQRLGLPITVQGEEPRPRLAAPVELALFRITQEALTNVAKHAQASQVKVTIAEDDKTVHLIIADDGLGFDPTEQADPLKRQGWGLLTMSERAEAVGGHCRIESAPGQGARVMVEVRRSKRGEL